MKEDPVNPKVLYCGTEGGLFVSLDQGQHWLPLGGLPPVPVDDLAIQALDAKVLSQDLHLSTSRPALGRQYLPGNAGEEGKRGLYRGANPPLGATFQVYLKADTGEDLSLAVTAADGHPVANLKAPGRAGLQRITWDLKPTSDLASSYRGEGSKFVRPGLYTATATRGAAKVTGTLQVAIAEDLETR